jgi:hypothetical protein
MAGDWIKMGKDLLTHPKVVRMASALRADKLRTVGGLFAVWCLFDEHSEDGQIEGYTQEAIDDLIGWPGFSAAMVMVQWLETPDGFCALPRFDEHNGQSAKRRAMETQRKRRERAEEDARLSALEADKKRSRTDKREDKKETPLPPAGGVARFEDFWSAWPANERKQDKVKCAKKWRDSRLDLMADSILADIAVKRQTQKWLDGFVEAPLVYLNGKRWEDGVTPNASATSDSGMFAGAI